MLKLLLSASQLRLVISPQELIRSYVYFLSLAFNLFFHLCMYLQKTVPSIYNVSVILTSGTQFLLKTVFLETLFSKTIIS